MSILAPVSSVRGAAGQQQLLPRFSCSNWQHPSISRSSSFQHIFRPRSKQEPITRGREAVPAARSSGQAFMSHRQVESLQSARMLRAFLRAVQVPYLEHNPTARRVLEVVRAEEKGPVAYDHFAFRTFGADDLGIKALAQVFLSLGYVEQPGELKFEQKKLRARWYSPPKESLDHAGGDGCEGPLPRVFISELNVGELSQRAQDIIRHYTKKAGPLHHHAALCSVLAMPPWPVPTLEHYERLAEESEYAAWTLVNAYSLNHTTISVHRLRSHLQEIAALDEFLKGKGVRLNEQGGEVKVSPDGGLLQSSTVADAVEFEFAGGERQPVPASYIEFAQRQVLKEFANLPADQVKEHHRRDGFEASSADKIFESTFAVTGVKA